MSTVSVPESANLGEKRASDPLFCQAHALLEALISPEQRRRARKFADFDKEPFQPVDCYQHGMAVAALLDDWQAPAPLVAAGLLHTFLWRSFLSVQKVREACGKTVADLCHDYHHILQTRPVEERPGSSHDLRRIQLYIAAYRDPALAFLGVADRWDHLAIAQNSDMAQRQAFSREARQLILPLLDMLGMWKLKNELDDWVMRNGKERRDYHRLAERLRQTEPLRRQAYEHVSKRLGGLLPTARLCARPRTPVQIYNPHYPEKTHPENFQKLTISLIVDSEEACYTALRAIHRLWRPIEGSLRDYVGASKLNGYRCLQTAVRVSVDGSALRVNFHICTPEMNEINEWGLAAIFLRDRLQADLPHAWWNDRQTSHGHIQSAPLGSLPDTLYVFSPQGQLFQMARGSTVVDYAYRVHSNLADQCKRFNVNGVAVDPTARLHHLDLVELEVDPRAPGPTRHWLNAARTSRARNYIKRFLRRQGKGSEYGRTILERRLKKLENHYGFNIPDHRLESALNSELHKREFDRIETLMAEIAAGRLSADSLLHPLFAEELIRQVQLPKDLSLHPHQLRIAQCCKPRLGDDFVGRARRRDDEIVGLSLHRADCDRIVDDENAELVPLSWRLRPPPRAVARLDVSALDEDGLLGDTLAVIYGRRPHVTLLKVSAEARHGVARLRFTVEADNESLIDEMALALEGLPRYNVDEVRKMKLLLSEWEELVIPQTTTGINPYNRLPVNDRDMLFGRSRELARVQEMLVGGDALICLRGQKRIGKTSLLLHLRDHYLAPHQYVPIFIDFQLFTQMDGEGLFYEIANAVYRELQTDGRIGEVGAPLRSVFRIDPPGQLATYLRDIQSNLGGRLVLLLDEFSSTIDAATRGELDPRFFRQWRGLIQATSSFASYILVVQQTTYDALSVQTQREADPSWQLMELGQMLVLQPLDAKNARHLIERPTRNYFRYDPKALDYVCRLVGGSPFLIHALCNKLVNHMGREEGQTVKWADVEAVRLAFMHPNENLFAHLLELVQGLGHTVCHHLAELSGDEGRPVSFSQLQAALPGVAPARLHQALHELVAEHILETDGADSWQFANLLFAQWLMHKPW